MNCFFNVQNISAFMKRKRLLVVILLFFSSPIYGACVITSSITNIPGMVSGVIGSNLDYVVPLDQNSPPVHYSSTAEVYCDGPSKLDIFDIGSVGINAQYTRLTERMLSDLKPTRHQGRIETRIFTSDGLIQSTANMFTREVSNVGTTRFDSGEHFTIHTVIPSMMLYSTIVGDQQLYETGGIVLSISDNDGGVIRSGSFIYIASIGSDFCVRDAFKASVDRPTIDFGNLSKNEIESGRRFSERFAINVERTINSACSDTISPKVIFNSGTLYSNTAVDLQNGLILKLKDKNGNEVSFGELAGDGVITVSDNKPLKMIFDAEIEQSPSKTPIKSGPFSSTIIYTMEYY